MDESNIDCKELILIRIPASRGSGVGNVFQKNKKFKVSNLFQKVNIHKEFSLLECTSNESKRIPERIQIYKSK